MKKVGIAAGALLGALFLFLAATLLGSELREVVVLTSVDDAGQEHETRLWVVDYGDAAWLRAGDADREWYLRVRQNREIRVRRNGEDRAYRVFIVDYGATREVIDKAMREKYGWTDAVIQSLEGKPLTVPIRLDPL